MIRIRVATAARQSRLPVSLTGAADQILEPIATSSKRISLRAETARNPIQTP